MKYLILVLQLTELNRKTNCTTSTPEDLGEKGCLFMKYIWVKVDEIFHNMRVLNTDASYYIQRDSAKFLQGHEKNKK